MSRIIRTFIISIIMLPSISVSVFAEPELVIQTGSKGATEKLKYSNDGKYIMGATYSEVKIYERESGILVKSFTLGSFKDFSPDAKYIVSVNSENNGQSIILTDIETREEFVLGRQKDDFVYSYSFSSDGKFIAASSRDCIDIYDVVNKTKKSVLGDSDYYFYGDVVWNVSGDFLSIAASKAKGCVAVVNIVYDLKNDRIVTVYDHNDNNQIYLTAISPNAKFVSYALRDKVYIRSVFSNDICREFNMPSEYGIKPLCLAFSQDGTKLCALKEKRFVECDLGTWNLNSMGGNAAFMFSFAVPKYSANELAIGAYQRIDVIEYGKWNLLKTISGVSHWIDAAYCHKNDTFFASDSFGAETALFNGNFMRLPQSDVLTKKIILNRMYYTAVGLYYVDYENKTIMLRDTDKNEDKIVLKNVNAGVLIASEDGSMLAFYDDSEGGTFIYDVDKKEKSYIEGIGKFTRLSSEFSSSGRYVFFIDDKTGKIYDTKNGKVLVSGDFFWGGWSFDEKYIAVMNKNNFVMVYDTKTWEVLKTFNTALYPFLSSDGQYVALYSCYDETGSYYLGKWSIRIYSSKDWRLVKQIPVPKSEYRNFFSSDGTKIITAGSSSIIKCYSAETGRLLTSTIGDANGDWLTYTPDGYFNGSKGGMQNFVHVVDGMEVTDIDQFAETLYRPDIVEARLKEIETKETSAEVSLSELLSSGSAPTVTFTDAPIESESRDITVSFNIQDTGGGIGAVYMSVNGKIVQLQDASRGLKRSGGSGGRIISLSHLLSLQNGDNVIEAYAMNEAGKIESRHAVAKIHWEGIMNKPNLFVLAVGVNKYRDRSLQLNYAVPDATAIIETFKNEKNSLYENITGYAMTDENVTKELIAKAFDYFADKVMPDDVFVFYLSGHGTSYTDGDYYFIPVDFRYRNSESVPEMGVSKQFIVENLSKIKAQKTITLLDTCNSGAFISTAQRGMAEKTAIDRLSRATGQATIAASSDTQVAMEGYEGHGIFTYVLLQALSGEADGDNDGYVTLGELSRYVEDKVPELSYDKWGYEQYPQVDLRKQTNFPIAGK